MRVTESAPPHNQVTLLRTMASVTDMYKASHSTYDLSLPFSFATARLPLGGTDSDHTKTVEEDQEAGDIKCEQGVVAEPYQTTNSERES